MATATRRRPPTRQRRGFWMGLLRILWIGGAWMGRSAWRLTAWGGPRITRATVAYGSVATRRYRERAALVAEHGNVPMVRDVTTGWWMPASKVHLVAPAGGDPQVREAHRLALVRQQVRDEGARAYSHNGGLLVQLTVIERLTIWWRGGDAAAVVMRMTRARMAVAARSAQRMSTATVRHWPPTVSLVKQPRHVPAYDHAEFAAQPAYGRRVPPAQRTAEPTPIDLDKLNPRKTGDPDTMANNVRTFADIESPDVDPFEYPEQLPGHLQEVAALMHENADELDEEVQALKQKSTSVDRYAGYMSSADVVPNVMSSIEEAREAYGRAMELMQQCRDAVAAAAEAMDAARLTAEAVYGDNEVPRFDKASA